MKTTFNWLRKHMRFYETNPLEILKNIEKVFFSIGLELEKYSFINPIFALKITSCQAIENSDKLKLCIVETPFYLQHLIKDRLHIVCGAHNAKSGLISALCPAGTKIPGGIIQNTKIRGVLSEGMFASSYEIGESREHTAGIIELKEQGIYRFDDIVLEISIPTNRWDLKNVRCLARNLCYAGMGELYDLPVKNANQFAFPIKVENNINVLASFVCVKNVSIKQEIINLMSLIGSASNHLQVLNDFVMLDIGHPIHIYDKEKVSSVKISRREAGLKIKTLKDIFITTGEEVIIEDKDKIMSIGGIIGCQGYNKDTNNIIIEAVYFEPSDISRLITESAKIFSLGIDDNQPTLPYITTLLEGDISSIYWCGQKRNNQIPVIFSTDFFYTQTGIAISINKAKQILDQREFVCTPVKNQKKDEVTEKFELVVIAPSWRRDIKEQFSIAEEIIKHVGYETIQTESEPINVNAILDFHTRIRCFLCDKGYIECINNPFSTIGNTKIVNPMQKNKSYLRSNLLESLLETAQQTLSSGEIYCRLFEIGKIYPSEEEVIAIFACGDTKSNFYNRHEFSFFHFKELVYSLSSLISIKEIEIQQDKIILEDGFLQTICDKRFNLVKTGFFAQVKLKASNIIKLPPRNYNYKNVSIKFVGNWKKLKSKMTELSPFPCEFLLSDLYNDIYTVIVKCLDIYCIDEIIEKIKNQ